MNIFHQTIFILEHTTSLESHSCWVKNCRFEGLFALWARTRRQENIPRNPLKVTGNNKHKKHTCEKKKQETNSKEFVASAVLGFFLSFIFILYFLILLYLIFLCISCICICRSYHQLWLVQHQDQQITQGFPGGKDCWDPNAMDEWEFRVQ